MDFPITQRQRSRSPSTFVPALPLTASRSAVRFHSSPVLPICQRLLHQRPRQSSPFPFMNSNQNQQPKPLWRRLLAVTTLSASMLFTPLPLSRPRLQKGLQLPTPPTALAASTTRTATSTTNTSDVETAAMTLAAVTLGGLVMRAIVRSRQDDDSYRKKVVEDSRRLQEEENLRALRIKRTEMEAVDGDSPDDDDFMKAFRERVSGLQTEDESERNDDQDATDKYGKQELDLVNTQDRGTGSAVLDKPDANAPNTPNTPSASQSDPTKGSDSDQDDSDVEPDSMAKAEQAEMLKRMWNLNSFDKND